MDQWWRFMLEPGVPDELSNRLHRLFTGLKIVGAYSPPYRALLEAGDAEVVDRINAIQ